MKKENNSEFNKYQMNKLDDNNIISKNQPQNFEDIQFNVSNDNDNSIKKSISLSCELSIYK